MSQLKITITVVEIVVAALVLVVLGDYLGYKFGHRRVASIAGIITVGVIVAFAIYAVVTQA